MKLAILFLYVLGPYIFVLLYVRACLELYHLPAEKIIELALLPIAVFSFTPGDLAKYHIALVDIVGFFYQG